MAERCYRFQDDAQLIKSKQTERIIHSAVVSEKIVCPVCLKADAKKPKFFLPGTGLQQHFRAMHRQRYDVSQEVAGKELIQKLHGEETRELLTILSNQRKSQIGFQQYRVMVVQKGSQVQPMDLVTKSTRECAKLFGLLLDHYGCLEEIKGKPCTVIIGLRLTAQDATQKFNIWKLKNEIYTQCVTPKPGMQLLRSVPTPLMEITSEGQMVNINIRSATDVLECLFGYTSFRPGQEEAIKEILSEKDTVVIIPTGGGKTIVYGVAGVMSTGITVVISPIIMLMYDQVCRLRECGINACYYNTLLSDNEKEFILHNLTLKNCQYEFIFTSPEAVLTKSFLDCLNIIASNNQLARFVIDEAHCIELWGNDFRPEYNQLEKLKQFKVPIIGLTGTATKHTISVITKVLGMTDYSLIKLPCRRDNLKFEIRDKDDRNSFEQIIEIIGNNFDGQSGIVYCATQDETSQLAFLLRQSNISSTYYHAGMDPDDKVKNSSLFMDGRVDVIAATIAFGMGIDKKDIRFVIHHSIPSSFEDLVQLSGRAGRDGEEAACIVLFRFMDRLFHLRNIRKLKDHHHQSEMLLSLNSITKFTADKSTCRQRAIATFFGEDVGAQCNICDNCQRTVQQQTQDLTEDAKNLSQCLQSMVYLKATVSMKDLSMVYMGSKSKDILDHKLNTAANYGKGKQQFKSAKLLAKFIQHLIINGFIDEKIKTGHELRQSCVYIVPGNTENLLNGKVKVNF